MGEGGEVSRTEVRQMVDTLWRSFLNFAAEGSQDLGQLCIARFEERTHAEAARMDADKATKYLAMIDEERGLIMDEYTKDPERLKQRLGVRARPQYVQPASNRGSDCFIATAVYGGYDMPQVRLLRTFRDQRLSSRRGQRVVGFYYRISPPLARWLGSRPRAAGLVRILLDGIVWLIRVTGKEYSARANAKGQGRSQQVDDQS